MLIVGITGRSGSGKSSVSSHYLELGYAVADGDAISREVTLPGSPCLAELVDAFGAQILQADGSLDRKTLATLAFASPQSNQKLIDITHPHIIDEFLRRADAERQRGAMLFFVDGAVIVGGPVQPLCDKLIVLVSESHLSVSRIILRDGISKKAAYNRLAAQQPEKVLREAADFIIENNGSHRALLLAADDVLAQLLRGAGEGGRRQ